MSFQLFIYYSAICGGWAALLAAAVVLGLGIPEIASALARTAVIGALLGGFVGSAIGLVDGLLNDKGADRLLRAGLCGLLGVLAGLIGATIGQLTLEYIGLPALFGWMIAGALIGASIGTFDIARGWMGGDPGAGWRKVFNGLIGGLLGGLLGGLPFTLVQNFQVLSEWFPRSSLATCLVLLGLLIGLAIGLAQIMLKEAWIRVEEGFRPGRELLLAKEETTIGRGEGCDLGLFGDSNVQRLHARILLQKNQYLLMHVAEEGETFLNDAPVPRKPVPLRAGDRIRIGKNVLQFGERQKKRT
jgi:hypothetical protein